MLRLRLPAPRRPRTPHRPRPGRPRTDLATALNALERTAFARTQDGLILDRPTAPADPRRLAGLLAFPNTTLDLALDHATRTAAHGALSHGWDVADLLRAARRRTNTETVGYLAGAVGLAAQWSASATWLAELHASGHEQWWTSAEPHAAQWAQRHGATRTELIAVAVDVLTLLEHLPRTRAARPDTPALPLITPGLRITDDRIATRIDALFARAARTSFGHEAEACAIKGQELLLRHSQHAPTGAPRITVVRPAAISA